jgi:hypothetical protein
MRNCAAEFLGLSYTEGAIVFFGWAAIRVAPYWILLAAQAMMDSDGFLRVLMVFGCVWWFWWDLEWLW